MVESNTVVGDLKVLLDVPELSKRDEIHQNKLDLLPPYILIVHFSDFIELEFPILCARFVHEELCLTGNETVKREPKHYRDADSANGI